MKARNRFNNGGDTETLQSIQKKLKKLKLKEELIKLKSADSKSEYSFQKELIDKKANSKK